MFDFISSIEKNQLLDYYLKNDTENFEKLLVKYPEFNNIDKFIKIAESSYSHFCLNKYCTFNVEEDDFFSLIDCTFKGYDDMLYIMSEDDDINKYPYIVYDHSCMLYIYIPNDFDDNPSKYKEEFIHDTILAVAENYVIVSKEDEDGLTGKTIENPDYIQL